MISVQNLSKSFSGKKVLDSIDLTINDSEIISITGASGAGKTTLLNIIGTLQKADEGRVLINGEDVTLLKDRELSLFRNQKIGFVFQFHNLLGEFTAMENAMLPYLVYNSDRKDAEERVKQLFDTLGIYSKLDSFPKELSGGEQQRVAIARALVNNPGIVLADEPSGNLDSVNARSLFDLFFLLREKMHQTFVIVTHSAELSSMTDRHVVISDGKITE